jgi:outer membrane protein TolC
MYKRYPAKLICRGRQWLLFGLLLSGGCQWFADDADRQVYRLVESRQKEAINEVHDDNIGRQRLPVKVPGEAYSFVPRPIDDSVVPEAFARTTSQPVAAEKAGAAAAYRESTQPIPGMTAEGTEAGPGTMPATRPASAPGTGLTQRGMPNQRATTQPVASRPARPLLGLSDALQYAFDHSRQFQTAKEDLYLAALDLTLERHLWGPIFFGTVGADYINKGQIEHWDDALEAVATVGVKQKLPYGGEVTAQVVNNFVRELSQHVISAETGAVILEANIPLLRGAGRSAYESRYQAERTLIYAVRTFEGFRRALAVDIAGGYFNLQQLRQQIVNAHETVESYTNDVARADALWRTGRIDQLDVLRADQDRLAAINVEVNAVEAYETRLDQFKIQLGMPVESEMDVEYPAAVTDESLARDGQLEPEHLEQALRMPDVPEDEAIRVALKYRLDLLNDMDRVDDASRGVAVAENNLLPDLAAFGTVQMDTNPDTPGLFRYNTERINYRTGVNLTLPLDRTAERNALRKSQISLQRAQRGLDESKDSIRVQVRRAMRQVQQQWESLQIQQRNRALALVRRRSARMWFELGKVGNRDVIEAQRALLDAQDRLAEAQSQWRLSILEFRLNTGTLRIDERGQWSPAVAPAPGNR